MRGVIAFLVAATLVLGGCGRPDRDASPPESVRRALGQRAPAANAAPVWQPQAGSGRQDQEQNRDSGLSDRMEDWTRRAQDRIRAGDWSAAISAARNAVAQDERSAPAWTSLGRALLGDGRAEEARGALERASDLTGRQESTVERLRGKAAEQTNRLAEAQQVYRDALAQNPADQQLTSALSQLAERVGSTVDRAPENLSGTQFDRPAPARERAATSVEEWLVRPESEPVSGSPSPFDALLSYPSVNATWEQWRDRADASLNPQPAEQMGKDTAVTDAAVVSHTDGPRMVVRHQLLESPWTESIVAYRLDQTSSRWVPAPGLFASLPTEVGGVMFVVRSNAIAINWPALPAGRYLALKDDGQTLLLCPAPDGADSQCLKAVWDGEQYAVPTAGDEQEDDPQA